MRKLGSKANRVALPKLVSLRTDQQLNLSLKDVGELLSRVSDHVPLVRAGGLEGEQVRLNRMTVTTPEQLVKDTNTSSHALHLGRAVAHDLNLAPRGIPVGVGEEIGDVKSEMSSNPLEAAERDASTAVLERREG